MNAAASVAGGSSMSQIQNSLTSSLRQSFSQRAYNYFKGTTQTFTNIQVASGVFNKNLKNMLRLNSDEDAQFDDSKQASRTQCDRRGKHQLFITSLYNKTVMLHLCPNTGEIYIHELDPNNSFKYTASIGI